MDAQTGAIHSRPPAPAPTALALGGSVLYAGNASTAMDTGMTYVPASLEITTVDVKNWVIGALDIPFFKERVTLYVPRNATQLTLTMEPQEVRVSALSVAPGQQRLSFLVFADYRNLEFRVGTGDPLIVPALSVASTSYITFDRGNEEITGRFRTSCTSELTNPADPNPDNLQVDRCEDLELTSQALVGFEPSGLTTLYGVP